MRLIAFRHDGVPTMGVVIGERVAPLAPIEVFYRDVATFLAMEAALPEPTVALDAVELLPPVPDTAKVVCVAFNYAPHAQEGDAELPDRPNMFARYAATLVASGAPIPVPDSEPGLDWEVELAVVMGSDFASADPARAAQHILGYTVFNDVSARVHQAATQQWALGKNSDNSGPIGPVLVTADAVDPTNLTLQTRVNGEIVQSGNTAQMVFSVPNLLAYAARTITLRAGDVVATGTPSGVGWYRTPRRLLSPGDVVEVEVEGIGVLRNPIVDSTLRRDGTALPWARHPTAVTGGTPSAVG